VATLLRTQPNFWIHLAAAAIVLALAFVFGLSQVEISILIVTIALVLILEAVNTVVETVCNLVSPSYHPLVKQAKDVSAAAVLISALAAVGVAVVLFVPRLLR
jgi:diacylglycerol kinase (ATP)